MSDEYKTAYRMFFHGWHRVYGVWSCDTPIFAHRIIKPFGYFRCDTLLRPYWIGG